MTKRCLSNYEISEMIKYFDQSIKEDEEAVKSARESILELTVEKTHRADIVLSALRATVDLLESQIAGKKSMLSRVEAFEEAMKKSGKTEICIEF